MAWRWSQRFSGKSPKFLTLTHQISLFADFTHLVQLFSLRNSKTTYSAPFKSFHMNLKVNLADVSLISRAVFRYLPYMELSFALYGITDYIRA